MSAVLDRILERKRHEVAARQARRPLAEVRRAAESAPPTRGFLHAARAHRPAVIAEIKRASPSAGVIRENFDPAAIAAAYERAGAACLSVLTDERFFQGADEHLQSARNACRLPTLRKDFIVDPYQLYETRALGADCCLLIVGALDAAQLGSLAALAAELGLDALVEVHNRRELELALDVPLRLLGINNRDLRTFVTRIETTIELLDAVPAGVQVVAESGINTVADVRRLRQAGVEAFLVGTAFMREPDPGAALQRLFEFSPESAAERGGASIQPASTGAAASRASVQA